MAQRFERALEVLFFDYGAIGARLAIAITSWQAQHANRRCRCHSRRQQKKLVLRFCLQNSYDTRKI